MQLMIDRRNNVPSRLRPARLARPGWPDIELVKLLTGIVEAMTPNVSQL